MSNKKVAFFTLGCKLNFSETSTLVRKFVELGYKKVEFNQKADVYVINTCSVTSMADKKSRYAIRSAIKHNSNALVAVIGCYSQLQPQEIAKIEGVDIVLGTKDKFKIFDYINKFEKGKTIVQPCEIYSIETFDSAYSVDGRTRSFLKVQDGCDYKCAYCTIPMARGKSRNPSIEKIISQAKEIEQNGIKEIILTGVNIGDFGKSTDETFYDLLLELNKLEKIERIRISSIEPNLLTDEIIQLVADAEKFMPHFHIPLQSGTNEILAKMKRRYRREIFADRIHKIKKLMPDAFIGVDIILGFPGETDELFEDAYNFVKDLDITYLHIFPYSDRKNTDSSKMENKINPRTINLRVQAMQQLCDSKHIEFYKNHLDNEYNVLFESANINGKIHGFTDNYIKVETDFDENLINQIKKVKLLEVNENETVKIEIL